MRPQVLCWSPQSPGPWPSFRQLYHHVSLGLVLGRRCTWKWPRRLWPKEASRVLVPRSDRSPQLVPDLSYSAPSWRRLASPTRVYYSNLRMLLKVEFFRASENAAHVSSVTASRELPEYLACFPTTNQIRTHIHADNGSSLLTSLSLGFLFFILPFMLLPKATSPE